MGFWSRPSRRNWDTCQDGLLDFIADLPGGRVVVAAGEVAAVDWVAEPEAKAFGLPCRGKAAPGLGGML